MQLANELKECDIDFWQLNEAKKTQLILDSTTIGKTRKTRYDYNLTIIVSQTCH